MHKLCHSCDPAVRQLKELNQQNTSQLGLGFCQCGSLPRRTARSEEHRSQSKEKGRRPEQGSRHYISLALTSHVSTAGFDRNCLISKSSKIAPESRSEALCLFGTKTSSSSKCLPVALVLKCSFSFKFQYVILKIMLQILTITNPHQCLMGMLNESTISINWKSTCALSSLVITGVSLKWDMF